MSSRKKRSITLRRTLMKDKEPIMRIKKYILNENDWHTRWIPISYNKVLSKRQLNKSLTFVWSDMYTVLSLCRAYYINKYRIEIGDLWLNPKHRGQKIHNEKISYIFMKRVINKIYKTYPNVKKITLTTTTDNIQAIKLYEKLNFMQSEYKDSNLLKLENPFSMVLHSETLHSRHDR